jgi:hypothetical protein
MKKLIAGAVCVVAYYALMVRVDMAGQMHKLYTTGAPPDVGSAYIAVLVLAVGVAFFARWLQLRLCTEGSNAYMIDTLPIEVDWTADPETNRSNSSPEFRQLVAEVARLIKAEEHRSLSGRVENTAQLVMAQLAHKHGLAPQKVAVQSVESSPEGVLHGVFVWNGVAYKYEATPI